MTLHAQLEFVDNVSGAFTDISTTGTALGLADDGDANFQSAFLSANVRVANNGGVAIEPVGGGQLFAGNVSLPVVNALGGNEIFLPFWDDLDTELGDVFVQDFADRFIVQWENRPHFNGIGATDGVTFQVQIFGRVGTAGRGDIIAQYLYEDVTFADQPTFDNGASATIGYQTDPTSAVQFSFDTASVNNGDVLTLRIPAPPQVLLFEDFENNTLTYTSNEEFFHDGVSDYFTITPLNGVANSVAPYAGFQGSNYFAAEDLDDGSTRVDTGTLIFDVDITGMTNLSVDLLFAAGGNGANPPAYDSDDGFLVRASLDGGSNFENLLAFEAEGEVNQFLRQDTDFDGVGDSLLVDENFLAYNLPITGTGNNLRVEVIFESNDGNVEFAIDDFSISGFASLELVDNVPGTFTDISAFGAALNLDDEGEADVQSTFLGANVRVGNNGGVAFEPAGLGEQLPNGNGALPNIGALLGSNEVFLPFWDDLDSDFGNVYVQDLNDRFIVQWQNRPHFPGEVGTDGVTFQVQIFGRESTSGPGDIIAQYIYEDVTFDDDPDANNGAEATIGYQTDITSAVQFSLNTASVNDGDVLTLRFPPLAPDCLLGDVNISGDVDFSDIAPFITVLSSGGFQCEADIDVSGIVDFADIAPFIGILSGT